MWGIPEWLMRLIFLLVEYDIIIEMLSSDMQGVKKKIIKNNFGKNPLKLFILIGIRSPVCSNSLHACRKTASSTDLINFTPSKRNQLMS